MIKIAIDAGHGYKTAGKRCLKSLDSNQTREWALNDRIADKLEELLRIYDCDVQRTDDVTGNKDVALATRVKTANNFGADIFISLHHNAGIKGGKGGGTVVYYYKATDKTEAQKLYNAIVAQTGLYGNRANKTPYGNFYVIRNTKMTALLLENGFMDSATDVPIILSEAHADKTAQGILNYLVANYELKKKQSTTQSINTVQTQTNFKVKVKVAALNYRSGAGTEYAVKGVIKGKGVYTIVATTKAKNGATWGKLKSGAGWINIGSAYVTRLV